MPAFQVKVEVIPHSGENDPESAIMQRLVYNSALECTEGITALQQHQLITFIINCANRDEAQITAQNMCDTILVNPVLASGNISIEEDS